MNLLRKSIVVAMFLSFICVVSTSAQEGQSTDEGTIDPTLAIPMETTPGKLKKARFAYATDYVSVTDSVGTAFSEQVKLKERGCISVKVSSQADIHNNDGDGARSMAWYVTLDGSIDFYGPRWWVPANPGFWDTYTGDFWLCDVPAGTHTIDVTFINGDSGDTAMVGQRSLEITYKR